MNDWLIYTRHCPRCGQGLCRVRMLEQNGKRDFFLLCDECDATWSAPDQDRIVPQPDPADTVCPGTDISVWSDKSHWASLLETIDAGWYGSVYIHRNRNRN